MSEANKDIIRRFIDEAWNAGEIDAVDEFIAEDHVDHDPAQAASAGGRTGARDFIVTYLAAFPDAHITIDELIAERDLVMSRWHAAGTHQGELLGIPGSGRAIEITGIGIDRIADGRIAESWGNWDTLGLLAQIGALPAPAGATA